MTIYIVAYMPEYSIESIYLSKEKANERLSEIKKKEYLGDFYEIEEYQVKE